MKVLVGLACAAIIAFVGYFFWGEWQASRDREASARNAFYAECQALGKVMTDSDAMMRKSDEERVAIGRQADQCQEFINTEILGKS